MYCIECRYHLYTWIPRDKFKCSPGFHLVLDVLVHPIFRFSISVGRHQMGCTLMATIKFSSTIVGGPDLIMCEVHHSMQWPFKGRSVSRAGNTHSIIPDPLLSIYQSRMTITNFAYVYIYIYSCTATVSDENCQSFHRADIRRPVFGTAAHLLVQVTLAVPANCLDGLNRLGYCADVGIPVTPWAKF